MASEKCSCQDNDKRLTIVEYRVDTHSTNIERLNALVFRVMVYLTVGSFSTAAAVVAYISKAKGIIQ